MGTELTFKINISNLFVYKIEKIATDIFLYKYQICIKENINKTSPNKNSKSNKSNEKIYLNIDNKDF